MNPEMAFLSLPYMEGASAWGEMTGTESRFCEMDCYLSSYIVEFINTISNLLYIYLGIRGIVNTRQHGKDPVVTLGYALLVCVGLGSTAYHTNIKYYSQMADELSMLYATTAILFGAFSITIGQITRQILALFLALVITIVAIAHCFLGEQKPFRICFGMMVVAIFFQCVWLLNSKVPERNVKGEMASLGTYGTLTFLTGLFVWKMDFVFCVELQAFRDLIGMPLGFVTELHGWWHILTGLGVYYFVVFIEYLRLYIMKPAIAIHTNREINLIWPSRLSLPRLEVREGKRITD